MKDLPEYQLEGDGCSNTIIVNSTARFRLHLQSEDDSFLLDSFTVSICDPYAHAIVVQRRILALNLLELTYQPMSIGKHQLSIVFDNRLILERTIDVVHDESYSLSKLRSFGPGLRHAIAGLPTEFYVDLTQSTNQNIHFRLEPSYEAIIDYEKQLATVRYVPIDDEQCSIQILENDRDILQSPFTAQIDKINAVHVKPNIYVIDLPKEMILHQAIEFQVSQRTNIRRRSNLHTCLVFFIVKVFIDHPLDDSLGMLCVDILTDDETSPIVSIHRRHRLSYVCSFTPVTLGRHWISVDYAGIVAENNPHVCQAVQGKDILLVGPAMNNQCLNLNQPTHFSFRLQDFQCRAIQDRIYTYESGYSSNDDISSKSSLSSSSNDINMSSSDESGHYRVTITDGHGHIKSNVHVHDTQELTDNTDIRVDFTPDEKILYINISCTW
jgi:hypothetical protein